MDTSDPNIRFDAAGVCNHCHTFECVTSRDWYPNAEGAQRWGVILQQMREAGRGRDYDCILGLSGGIDSSYVALKAKEWQLRPLVVHVDAGWNSELAVANIEKIVKYCNLICIPMSLIGRKCVICNSPTFDQVSQTRMYRKTTSFSRAFIILLRPMESIISCRVVI